VISSRPTPSGTTGEVRRTELQRKTPLKSNSTLSRTGSSKSRRSTLGRGGGFAASKAQQEKARSEPCVVTGQETLYGATVDPAHLWPRSKGGCDSDLCTVPLVRHLHRLFDEGEFDLLPYLKGRLPELHHALDHADGDLCGLLHRLTGERPYGRRLVA
jgi:hypothetical protein